MASASTVHRRKPHFGEVKFQEFMEDCKGATTAKVRRFNMEAEEENRHALWEASLNPVGCVPPEEESEADKNELDRSLIELSDDENDEDNITME